MLKLTQTLKLQQKLAPQMIQSLQLLQLPTLELEQLIKQELEANPLLETEEAVEEKEEESVEEEVKENQEPDPDDEISFDENYWNTYFNHDDITSGARQEIDPNEEEREFIPVHVITIWEDLLTQLHLLDLTDREMEIGEFIIGCLDDNGYLRAPKRQDIPIDPECDKPMNDKDAIAAEIVQATAASPEEAERMIKIIQTLDPPGIGARDLQECLMIQLREKGMKGSLPYRVLKDHFDLFKKRRFREITRAMNITDNEMRQASNIISSLTPKPGAAYPGGENLNIIPDVIVEKVEGEYIIQLNDRRVPRLHVNNSYRTLLLNKDQASDSTREYIVEKLNSARWLINSIEQRRNTIIRVMKAIVKHQYDFLDHGIEYLKPMILQDVADEIDMHISTVARVTKGKYAQTPQGVFELRYFFDQRLQGSNGEEVSAKSIRKKISDLISQEDHQRPLSDQKIADKLTEEGIEIARRTVQKYREELRIPSARMRKEF